MIQYLRYKTPVALLLGFFLWSCGDSENKTSGKIPAYEVHSGSPQAESNKSLTGTYSLAFTEPLAPSTTSKSKVFLQFQLQEGGTLIAHTFATNKTERGEKKLRMGIHLSFTRKGDSLRGAFVTCCGAKVTDLPPLPEFDARSPISMYLVIDNEKPQIRIYKDNLTSAPLLDTESPEAYLAASIYPGTGTYWGVSVTQGTLHEARTE